jgi:sporulation protein YlmC with PRC-barrel domain
MRVRALATVFTCFGLSALLVNFVSAADKPLNRQAADGTAAAASERDQASAKIDKKTEGSAARVSQIRGMTVRNSGGKDLGDIKDLMLDMGEHGRVRYAALAFGGFLGMGDKLFAIPWRSLKFEHDANKNKNFAVFDVSEDTLKKMPGFDKNHWPDMADRRWMDATDKHHGIDIRAGNTEVQVRTEVRDTAPETAHNDRNWRLHRANEAVGMQVRNAGGDKLGKVEDIVIGLNRGDIRYVALSFGGFLGIGDKFFAVPWDAVMVHYDADSKDFFVMFDVTKEQLKNAPGFDKDHWPDFANEQWAKEVGEFYKGHRREAKATTETRVK